MKLHQFLTLLTDFHLQKLTQFLVNFNRLGIWTISLDISFFSSAYASERAYLFSSSCIIILLHWLKRRAAAPLPLWSLFQLVKFHQLIPASIIGPSFEILPFLEYPSERAPPISPKSPHSPILMRLTLLNHDTVWVPYMFVKEFRENMPPITFSRKSKFFLLLFLNYCRDVTIWISTYTREVFVWF